MRTVRPWLVMSRASNLPTVWSNCLAGFWLGSGSDYTRFAGLSGGASLLYVGGTLLNDACDAAFDSQYRPERPIPSSAVRRQTVWVVGGVSLAAGATALAALEPRCLPIALLLCGLIVTYDVVHKRTVLSPLLMGSCRALLYPLSATVAGDEKLSPVLGIGAVAVGLYVVAISSVARREGLIASRKRVVTSMLAAMPLVDLAAAGWTNPLYALVFVVFAATTIALQRVIPAT
jgi:4-hydroxybenzoate polyprenyltransferase